MTIEKKPLPTKSDNNTKAAPETTQAGKPSSTVGSSDAVTPSFNINPGL